MSIPRLFAVLAALAALAGCAALPPAGEPARKAAAFDVVGRVAVTWEGRAFSSGVRWEHLPERDEIWLLTPTGQALAHILSDASGATLTGADQNQVAPGKGSGAKVDGKVLSVKLAPYSYQMIRVKV